MCSGPETRGHHAPGRSHSCPPCPQLRYGQSTGTACPHAAPAGNHLDIDQVIIATRLFKMPSPPFSAVMRALARASKAFATFSSSRRAQYSLSCRHRAALLADTRPHLWDGEHWAPSFQPNAIPAHPGQTATHHCNTCSHGCKSSSLQRSWTSSRHTAASTCLWDVPGALPSDRHAMC